LAERSQLQGGQAGWGRQAKCGMKTDGTEPISKKFLMLEAVLRVRDWGA
jgi:hypothetical protein